MSSKPKGFLEYYGGLSLPIIAVGNLKGGVGKTTTTAYLAHCFSRMRLRVLVMDMDYQGSLSNLLLKGKEEEQDSSSVNELLKFHEHQIMFSNGIITDLPQPVGKISLVTASTSLASLENSLLLRWLLEREKGDVRYRLATQLMMEKIKQEYDLVLIDTPPRMTVGVFNTFVACSHVLIPTSLKRTSWDRVPAFNRLLETIKRGYNPRLAVLGIALTLTSYETRLRSKEEEELRRFKERLKREDIPVPIFERHIPRWDKLGEADFSDGGGCGYI